MPDTEANQEVWPQTRAQKPGCGFPQARICAYFDLASGMLSSFQIGNKKSHELPLLRKQWKYFDKGDIFLGDKMFCCYSDISRLVNLCALRFSSFKVMPIDSFFKHRRC